MEFKEQLVILINHVTDEYGERYTSQQIADGTDTSKSLIDKLRQGTHSSPSLETVKGLANFFGVGLAYFDCESANECLDFLNVSRNIKFRSETDVTIENQRQIQEIMAWIQADQEARKRGDESPPMPWTDNAT